MITTERIGHADQVALVTGERAIDIRVYRGIDLRLHADRGLDIGAAWFRGFPLAWISSAGEGGTPAGEWRDAWGGGLLTTCGLDNVGAPSEGFGLHGTYTFLPARDVSTERSEDEVACSATIEDPRGLRVERTIRTRLGEGRVELTDRTVNGTDHQLEAPVLYHVNLGWPLWDVGARLESDADAVVPRDDDAAGHSWAAGPPPAASPERVWEHVGASRVRVVNEEVPTSGHDRVGAHAALAVGRSGAGRLRARDRARELLRPRPRTRPRRRSSARARGRSRQDYRSRHTSGGDMSREIADLKAGVVGTGFIGVVHVDALRRLGIEVAGVVGSTPERAAAKGIAPVYESYEALLADERVDVVHLTTPNHLHHSQVKQALAAGKHVVCEKPLATTSEESAELVELAEASGLVHCTNFNIRFYPMNQEARERVHAGELGDVWNVHGGYLQDWLATPTDWNWRLEPEKARCAARGRRHRIALAGSDAMDHRDSGSWRSSRTS